MNSGEWICEECGEIFTDWEAVTTAVRYDHGDESITTTAKTCPECGSPYIHEMSEEEREEEWKERAS